ncbi:uncharacterized protein [Littorina saxatilis]|uniref:Apple domain-containing protein n=1 Tax=Littorina saxatilis TaxID=31220 RepID=A0AAN9G6J8_9CAEN
MALFTTVCWALSLLLMWTHSVECTTRQRVCTTLAHEKEEVPWLERSCASDADCHDGIHAECFKGKCLCTLGYYYSNGQAVCVDNCPESDQQAEFLTYPDSFLRRNNYFRRLYGTTLVNCLAKCVADTGCIVAGYNFLNNQCTMYSVSPFSDTNNFGISPNESLYQQRCK